MKNIFALLGLAKYALANIYMSRDERRRVHWCARKSAFAALLAAAQSAATSLTADARTIVILCGIGMRNLLRNARVVFARDRSPD